MVTIPPKRLLAEGAFYLIVGSILGILLQTILHTSAPTVAPKVTHASFKLIEVKMSLFQRLGLKQVFSILLANAVSVSIIIGLPIFGLKYDKTPKLYTDTFPKMAMFAIGFLSLGLIAPPLKNPMYFLFFILYLIPHGFTEIGSMVLAFTIPREFKHEGDNPLPKGRIRLIIILLIYSAVVETYLSVPLAKLVFVHAI